MIDVNKEIVERRKELENLLKQIQLELDRLPEGRLRISHESKARMPRRENVENVNRIQYYQCGPKMPKNGKYLQKSQMDLVCQLAQKGYLLQLQKAVQDQIDYLSLPVPDLSDRPLQSVYSDMLETRKALVNPLKEDNESFIARWQAVKPPVNTMFSESAVFVTERGESVRSKSEKILADKFYMMGIPYHYEMPIRLIDNREYYPDFTLLNKRTLEIFFWEHRGLMDDPNYVNSNLRKHNLYIRSGIIPGKNLITTYETRDQPLDMAVVEALINTFLL